MIQIKKDLKVYYPPFFDTLPTIRLQDDLSNFLGSFEDGIVEFSYLDVVKAAGHSCPTVAGAYLLSFFGLQELYKDKLPKRGEIKVYFKESADTGVAGVIANVISHITGATECCGFKGIGGKFARYGLMEFNSSLQPNASVRFERVDIQRSVEILYDPSDIPTSPELEPLMHLIMQNKATDYEKKLFGKLWQQKVEYIFLNKEKVITIL